MTEMPFQIVDVFGAGAFAGNPLAVITTPIEIDTDRMLAITRWLNFSETTFLLPPTDPAADYRVRIFTPARELPFAGHPTLGSCHAWLKSDGVPKSASTIIQQCGAGLVRLSREGERLSFAAPPTLRSGPVDSIKLEEIAAVLGISVGDIRAARWVDNGPGWVAVMLGSAEAVLAVGPARWHSSRLDLGIIGLYPAGHASGAAYEIRALFSDTFGGLIEDPVCGSLNASVAQWLIEDGIVTAPYQVSQGARVGRNGRIDVAQDDDGQVWIGGETKSPFAGLADIQPC